MNWSSKHSSNLVFFGLFLLLGMNPLTFAEESKEGEDLVTIKTQEGLIFKVPPDMPIVKRDGVVSPIPLDEYLYQKVKKLTERLDELDNQRMDVLNMKLKAFDEKIERLSKQIQELERELHQTPPP